MRPQKVDQADMMQGLLRVLRARGYDGASLKEFAEATGLKKASLYHRFPGGKEEMTAAVLAYTASWVEQNIYQVLTDSEYPPAERLTTLINNLRAFYADGDAICIFRALSTETGLDLFGLQLKKGMERWQAAFTELGLELGHTLQGAQLQAQQSLISIQGSLIVAQCLGQQQVFLDAVEQLKPQYLESNHAIN